MRARRWTIEVATLCLLAAPAWAALVSPGDAPPEAAQPVRAYYQPILDSVSVSPDSRRVVFAVHKDNADARLLSGGNLFLCAADRPKEECRTFGERADWLKARFSPDGRFIAGASADGASVWVWSADALRPLTKLSTPYAAQGIAFSPDGRLLSVFQGHRIRVYSVESGKPVRDLESVFGGLGLRLKEAEGRIVVEDTVAGSPSAEEGILKDDELREADGASMAGLTLLQAVARLRGEAGTKVRLTVFRPSAGKEKRFTIKRGSIPDPAAEVFFLPDGRLAAFAQGVTRVWSMDSGAQASKVDGWLGPDGRVSLLGDKDKGLVLRSYPDGQELGAVKLPADSRSRISPDARWLAAWEPSGRGVIYSARDGEPLGEFRVGGSNIMEVWFSPDGRHLWVQAAGEPLALYENPLAPRRFVAKADAELKSTSGKVLTKLPVGAEVAVERAAPGSFFVSVGESLKGYVKAGDLSLGRPDVLKPVVRVIEKSFKDPVLRVKGVAYDDIAMASVKVAGTAVPRAAFDFEKGNYGDGYPFEAKVTLTPDTPFSIRAEDASGKVTELPISIDEPVLDYSPRYVHVELLRKASARKTPSAEAEALASLGAKTVVVSLGEKDAWYCLEGGGWLAKADARELEAAPEPSGQAPLSLSAGPSQASPKVVRAASDVDADVPRTGREDPDAVAVVFGVRDYKNKDVPAVEYALADARAVRDHLVGMLGVPEGNVIYVENPTQGDFARVFGTRENPRGQLHDYIKPGKSDVYVYYSGHGAPDLETKSAYFVPSDATPDYVRLNGYPLELFYANLARLPARSVFVALDACFSGSSHKGMLLGKASPLVVTAAKAQAPANVDVLSSSGQDEISSWYPEKGHSLFTYYFLRGMRDEYSKDGEVRLGKLRAYVEENVPYQARKMFGRSQRPQFQGNERRALLEKP